MEEQPAAAPSPSTAAPSAVSAAATTASTMTSSGKSGQQLLHELLAVAYHVFEEAKYMNLKPPLQPSSKLFAADSAAPASPSRSPPESPQEIDNTSALEANGHNVATTPTHASSAIGQPVIPYLPEEIQDTYTKIAALKNQYVKISTELLELLKHKDAAKPEPSEEQQKQTETMEKLRQRRNQLRREVYERNMVMKGLIDRLRHLQHAIRVMNGSSHTSELSGIVMESV